MYKYNGQPVSITKDDPAKGSIFSFYILQFSLPPDIQNQYWPIEVLLGVGFLVNPANTIHSLCDPPERSISLSVGVILSPVIKSRLIVQTNKEFRICRSGCQACKRYGSSFMSNACGLRVFMRDRGQTFNFLPVAPDSSLHKLSFRCIRRLVIEIHNAVKAG